MKTPGRTNDLPNPERSQIERPKRTLHLAFRRSRFRHQMIGTLCSKKMRSHF